MRITKRSGSCDENTFWQCVAEIKWPVESVDRTKAAIMRAWTPEFGTAFRNILVEKTSHVSKVFNAAEPGLEQSERDRYYLSDDGLSDFCAHVVGLGQEIFLDETARTDRLVKRAIAEDYEENFSYCVPYEPTTTASFEEWCTSRSYASREEDWDPDDENETFDDYLAKIRENWTRCIKGDWWKIESSHYGPWAAQYLRPMTHFLAALSEPSTEDERVAIDLAGTLRRYLNLLIEQNTEEALKISELALYSWWGLYHLAVDAGALRVAHVEILPMVGDSMYGGENLINDHREFLGDQPRFRCRFHLKQFQDKRKEAS